eukprot:TRINITY_DN51882_c0_g1_i1.p1 TRINITY_DN51882_c0_g1~~TRINITY_DN51882_c0_g1_i1.p1  ORF type:complete len:560 (-),score=105.41 TRINITY_DN51882_c0_g1_i1:206-1885(-)
MQRSRPCHQADDFPLRLLTLLRLPFDLVTCIGLEIAVRLTLAVDDSSEQLPARTFSPTHELLGTDPSTALRLALKPWVPAFKRAICEGTRSTRDSAWVAYQEQAKSAAELSKETQWLEVARLTCSWARRQSRLFFVVYLPRLKEVLVNTVWPTVYQMIASRLQKGNQTPVDVEEILRAVETTKKECEAAKGIFQTGDVQGAATRYAVAYDMLKKHSDSLKILNAWVWKSDPAQTEALKDLKALYIRILVNLAVCNKKLGNLDQVIGFTSQTLSLEPQHIKALFLRAEAHVASGNPKQGAADFERVVYIDPSNYMARTELAKATQLASSGSGGKSEAGTPSNSKGDSKSTVDLDLGLSKAQILTLMEDMVKIQKSSQETVSSIVRQIQKEGKNGKLSFADAYKKIEEKGIPKDPLAAYNLTEENFQEMLVEYDMDEDVIKGAGELLQPAGKGDPEKAKTMELRQIVEIHKCMVKEMRLVLKELEELPSEQRKSFQRKGCECAAEVLISLAVEAEYAVKCEDVEQAVILFEGQLQQDAEFMEGTEDLAVLMQGLSAAIKAD